MATAQDLRFGLYDADGNLVREIEHDKGRFKESVELAKGECIFTLGPSVFAMSYGPGVHHGYMVWGD